MDADVVKAHWEGNAESWTQLSRAGCDIYRDAVNTPAFLALLPPIAGLAGLDLGCGEGSNTRLLAQRGAKMRAIDLAPTFIRHAQEVEAASPLGIDYQLGDAAALPFADASFDFVTAFMVLMDVPDPAAALRESRRVLRPGGFLQFSLLHPCFVPPYRKVLRDERGQPRAIEIAGYFEEEGRVNTWRFGGTPAEQREKIPPFRVPHFHRTLSSWIDLVLTAGFTLRRLAEPSASVETAARVPAVADTRIAGMFLHVQAWNASATNDCRFS